MPEFKLIAGLEPNQHDFRFCANTHWSAPGACAPVRKNEQVSDAAEPVNEPAVNARCDPGIRQKLPAVGVSRKLQRDPLFFSNSGAVRRMGKQNAGAPRVERSPPENGPKQLRVY